MKIFEFCSLVSIFPVLSLVKCLSNEGFQHSFYNVNEKDGLMIQISRENSNSLNDCTVKLSPDMRSRISLKSMKVTFWPTEKVKYLQLVVLKNNVPCDSTSVRLSISCSNNFHKTFLRQFTDIRIMDQTSSAERCGDSHLIQNVKASNVSSPNQMKKLCYDLYGKSGDQFEIISDIILDTSVHIKFRDDYYIGKVFLRGPFGTLEVNTTHIKTPSNIQFSWNDIENIQFGKENEPKLIIKISTDDVTVTYRNGSRILKILITRIEQKYEKHHLNISIGKEMVQDGVFDKFYGGILGQIANNIYEFYSPVRENENRVAIRINGRYVKSRLNSLDSSREEKCYATSLDDLLFPKRVNEFQKSL